MNFNSITPHNTRDRSNILRVCRPQYRSEGTTQRWGPEGHTIRVQASLTIPSGAVGDGDQTTNITQPSSSFGPWEQTYTGGMACIDASHRHRPSVPTRRALVSTSDACGLRILGKTRGEQGTRSGTGTTQRAQQLCPLVVPNCGIRFP